MKIKMKIKKLKPEFGIENYKGEYSFFTFIFIFIFILTCPTRAWCQPWVDTTYAIQTETDIEYGEAVDFAGTSRSLLLDVSYPTDDTPPACGRPLLVMVHGGGWFAGSKSDFVPKRIREDFAKRGYVTASVNYRLGQFHTDQFINCNIPGWNCWNMTDSSEWYRANYRGIHDVHGAIRYLIKQRSDYLIDPENVFVVGESAGGFVAIGVGFLDDDSEVLDSLVGALPDAPVPNNLYEGACIQEYGLADAIDSMDLSRPDLGSYEGTLHFPAEVLYQIKAVGNFYGGAFNNIFESHSGHSPALYLYHQPCDLIVPFGYDRLLTGYNNCLAGFPANCGNIVNRPLVSGSQGIQQWVDGLQANSLPAPDYYIDFTTNNYNCLQQVGDPNFACHAIDNYWLRTVNMAVFFADQIDTCTASAAEQSAMEQHGFRLYPNPARSRATISFDETQLQVEMTLIDAVGVVRARQSYRNRQSIEVELEALPPGLYTILLNWQGKQAVRKLVFH